MQNTLKNIDFPTRLDAVLLLALRLLREHQSCPVDPGAMHMEAYFVQLARYANFESYRQFRLSILVFDNGRLLEILANKIDLVPDFDTGDDSNGNDNLESGRELYLQKVLLACMRIEVSTTSVLVLTNVASRSSKLVRTWIRSIFIQT